MFCFCTCNNTCLQARTTKNYYSSSSASTISGKRVGTFRKVRTCHFFQTEERLADSTWLLPNLATFALVCVWVEWSSLSNMTLRSFYLLIIVPEKISIKLNRAIYVSILHISSYIYIYIYVYPHTYIDVLNFHILYYY